MRQVQHLRRSLRSTLPVIACACLCLSAVTVVSTLWYVIETRARYPRWIGDYNAIVPALHTRLGRGQEVGTRALGTLAVIGDVQQRAVLGIDGMDSGRVRPRTKLVQGIFGLTQVDCTWEISHLAYQWTDVWANASLHVFFIHGNAGGSAQGAYWGCTVQYAGNLMGIPLETYSFMLAEQANIHRGRLIATQADYVADVVEAVVQRKRNAAGARVEHHVWLVGHSMGGVVARLAAHILDPSILLQGILTINSPARFPPLFFDAHMADTYRALLRAEARTLSHSSPPLSPLATSTRRCSSDEFIRGAMGERGDCRVGRFLRSSIAPRFLSMTSGEMDLQIDPATTYPFVQHAENVVSFFDTSSPTVCGQSHSHDGVLRDSCAMAYAALQLVFASCNMSGARHHIAKAKDMMMASRGSSEALPTSPSSLSFVAYPGQIMWTRHVWPCALATFYGHLLLSGMRSNWKGTIDAASGSGADLPRSVYRFFVWLFAMPRLTSIIAVSSFYLCTCSYTALVTAFLWFGRVIGWEAAVAPWQWACFPQLRCASTGWVAPVCFVVKFGTFLLTSVGPVVLGAVGATMVVELVGLTQRANCCPWQCSGSRATHRHRLPDVFVVSLGLLCCYGALVAIGATLTTRAFVWLLLLVAAPLARHPPRREVAEDGEMVEHVERAATTVEIRFPSDVLPKETAKTVVTVRRLPGLLFNIVYLIQLHPFFTIRNAFVSATYDDAATVDGWTYVVESCVLVFLLLSVLNPDTIRIDCRPIHAVVGALSSAVAAVALALLMSHPIESFRILTTLLWCFPSFVCSTLTT